MDHTNDCIFCKIFAGELEVSLVHQDDLCTAFLDIQPLNPGHVLVVPNRHANYLIDLGEEGSVQMFRVAQRLATALRRSGVKCEGVNFFLADGEAAGRGNPRLRRFQHSAAARSVRTTESRIHVFEPLNSRSLVVNDCP
jgi:diadenosine tetraphosphate (Ap4A) HIT family hydrolase